MRRRKNIVSYVMKFDNYSYISLLCHLFFLSFYILDTLSRSDNMIIYIHIRPNMSDRSYSHILQLIILIFCVCLSRMYALHLSIAECVLFYLLILFHLFSNVLIVLQSLLIVSKLSSSFGLGLIYFISLFVLKIHMSLQLNSV